MRLAPIAHSAECPRYHKCSASICPADPDWQSRAVTKDDSVCFYLLEACKDGAATRFEAAGELHMLDQVHRTMPAIKSAHPRLRDALNRARLSGSKMARRKCLGDANGEV